MQIVTIVLFTFLCYLSIGLPLAVLPGYVHDDLGYGSVIAGAAISIQYVSILLMWPFAGRMADKIGPKKTVMRGLLTYGASGVLLDAALSLTVFGTLFCGARLLFAGAIKKHGGFRVAIASFLVETCGLLTLWLAPIPQVALAGAALIGLGFALVFPALGVEAVALVPPASRGAALSAYSVFLDLSLGLTRPLARLIASDFGYESVYLFAAVAAVLSIVWAR
ncbi:MFS transporter [Mycetohabitans sp. B4]|nr:MFS transporter [Mycetohabitans sp. B4]MCG1019253.1 MFS transporter [Mycetohabitans sp. B4]SIT72739.1 Major Facilitator Superfamily protein [Burkholderia sp. b13]